MEQFCVALRHQNALQTVSNIHVAIVYSSYSYISFLSFCCFFLILLFCLSLHQNRYTSHTHKQHSPPKLIHSCKHAKWKHKSFHTSTCSYWRDAAGAIHPFIHSYMRPNKVYPLKFQQTNVIFFCNKTVLCDCMSLNFSMACGNEHVCVYVACTAMLKRFTKRELQAPL